jgi:hypothetical protein
MNWRKVHCSSIGFAFALLVSAALLFIAVPELGRGARQVTVLTRVRTTRITGFCSAKQGLQLMRHFTKEA